MFFTWIFSTVSLVSLLVAKFFFVLSPDTNALLLALALIGSMPWIPLVFSHIKRDIKPLRSLASYSAIGGYIVIFGLFFIMTILNAKVSTMMFILTLLFSVYFHIDGKIYFTLALGGVITTIWSLVFDMPMWTESASIIVYYSLVIGVFVEIGSSWFDRIHTNGIPLIFISSEFKASYRQALAEYTWAITIILQLFFILALLGYEIFWNLDYSMLVYVSFGIWIFFALHLLTSDKKYSLQDFMTYKLSSRYSIGLFRTNRYILYSLIVGVFCILVLLIVKDIFIKLPIVTNILLTLLVFFLIGIGVYTIISSFYRR